MRRDDFFSFLQAEDGIRDYKVTGVQTCALPILAAGDYDAIVLAAAGLARLGHEPDARLPETVMTPAPGQGCLALEARADDEIGRASCRGRGWSGGGDG